MKKILISLIVVMILLMALFASISTATISINSADLYLKGRTEKLLKFEEAEIGCAIVVYNKNGIEYPAYCLNNKLPGVGEFPNCTVSINEMLGNVKVWRAIVNGYPYKTIESLGCANEGEAFLATKQAVYCMLYDRNPDEYSAIGEAGERTLNALKQIVQAANNSSAIKPSSELIISSESALWTIDSINSKYISRTFEISANAPVNSFAAMLEGNIPEGTIITDLENNEKQEFNSGEKLKILIPLLNIEEDGNFYLKVSGYVKTKPILFGASGNPATQDYALTGDSLEEGFGQETVYYSNNESKIIITKKDETTGDLLQGAEFQLLDENENVLQTELTTNENGIIEIENLLPGTYYIKETKTLEGYSIYDKLIKVELSLNETVNITVNNSLKETIFEKNPIETNIEVLAIESKQEVEVKEEKQVLKIKLPKTGM